MNLSSMLKKYSKLAKLDDQLHSTGATRFHMIGADEITNRNVDRLVQELGRSLDGWRRDKKLTLIHFGISAYDDDPRALFDIPEVRDWAVALRAKVPFILSVIDASTLDWFLPCIGDIEITRQSEGTTNWRMKPESLSHFFDSVQEAQHAFFTKLADTQAEYDQLNTEMFERLKGVMPAP